MKLPLSWLREFVDLDGIELDELTDLMGLRGLEVEEVTFPGAGASGIRTARVLTREPHPNADKLQFVTVTGEGGEGSVEVVCGARNFEVGDVVVHAFPGSSIAGGMELSARELRGVLSNGMLCSATELGLGTEADGILRLDPDTDLGVDFTTMVPLGEPVIEVAVMADRGDHHSILGVARDLAAILERELREPPLPALPATSGIPIRIDAADGCTHFVGVTLDDVTDGTSPWWLRFRLHQCGVRAISTIVDVTNYVMLERGQPLHAFDQAKLAGPEIVVRTAAPGETLTTLDGAERRLEPTDLVVADGSTGAALAGVMGGLDSEVTDATTTVLLEAAVWEPDTIRDTAARLNLTSEASLRFARRVDPAGAAAAEQRAVQLLTELAGATASATTVAGAPGGAGAPITYDHARYGAFLGLPDLDADAQSALLRRAGCDVTDVGATLTVLPPSWRGDLLRPVDVAEEVMRLHGAEHVPAELPALPTSGGLDPSQLGIRQVRRAAEAAGFDEAITRPFVGDGAHASIAPDVHRVVLANPLAKDAAALRPGLLDGLLAAVRRNVGQGRPGTMVYEIGRVFRQRGGPLDALLDETKSNDAWTDRDGAPLPTQPRALGLAAQGSVGGPGWTSEQAKVALDDLFVVVDEIAARLAPDRRVTRVAVERDGMHPTRTAAILLDGTEVGVVGQLHPTLADDLDLPEPVLVGELLLEPFVAPLRDGAVPRSARSVSRQPAMVFDVAVVGPVMLAHDSVRDAVAVGAGDLLDELTLFDEFRGEQVGEGNRSLGFRLRLQASDRALGDEDEKRVLAAVETAVTALGATLRR